MKKLLLLALTAVMMVGCDYNSSHEFSTKDEGYLCGTIVIDSCEYIRGASRLAHKGNCKFCAERRKQEIKRLIKKLKKGDNND
jgi:hypothetical protein